MSGNTVRYVVNRNINYTNVCHHGCSFCAFSKGRHSNAIQQLRGSPYDLGHDEIARLKRLVADQALHIQVLKEVNGKKW